MTNAKFRARSLLMGSAFCIAGTTGAEPFISEIHYDNAGSDRNEAIEVSASGDTDLTSYSVVLYNGNNGRVYQTSPLSNDAWVSDASCGDNAGTLVLRYPTNGIQNGNPDGLALVRDSDVVSFLSYEGSFTATDGPAAGMISTDIGQRESGSASADESLQLVDGTWQPPAAATFGVCTTAVDGGASLPPGFTELHYDNAGADDGEAVEISGTPGTILDGWQVVAYNGRNGEPYANYPLSGTLNAAPGCGEGNQVLATPGLQNGSPDGLALVDPFGVVQEFISYEGSFTAVGGPADGLESEDIGVAESSSTAIGDSLQKIDGVWVGPQANTFGRCVGGEPSVIGIHDIQGDGPDLATPGEVLVEAVVVGDFQAQTQLRGFFLQEEDVDADNRPETSEGIFVFCGGCAVNVAVGDRVRVRGNAVDFFGMTQIAATDNTAVEILDEDVPLPSPASLSLPITVESADLEGAEEEVNAYFEALEGMLIQIPERMTVSETFQLNRFGQLVLSSGGRPRTFTDANPPSVAGLEQHRIDLLSRRLILDDDNNTQNAAQENNTAIPFPSPGLSISNRVRGGDSVVGLTGVLHWSFAGTSGTDAWRLRPVEERFDYDFEPTNPRNVSPKPIDGDIKVASFNVLNYFTTLDDGQPACGPEGTSGCRGANSAAELERQTQKTVAAICALDADVLGLMEIENPRRDAPEPSALETLVEAVNRECPNYAAVATGSVGGDAITVALMYRPARVTRIGAIAVLDTPEFTDPFDTGRGRNRPAIAATFKDPVSERSVTVVVNHLKSKGSSCGEGDDDQARGQANCNLTRTRAAERLAQWLESNPTRVWNDDHVLIIGDLNAYRREDPLMALRNAGYIDLVDREGGNEAYGYVFDGQLGYLDHALANPALAQWISGVTEWHINADEPTLFDYNDTIVDLGERDFEAKPSALPLFAADPFRSSDHDPVLVGIRFPNTALCHGQEPTIYVRDQRIVGGPDNGQPFNGVLNGTSGNDVILGTGGDDQIYAGSGNDLVCSEAGNDQIEGGSGNDVLAGGPGDDQIKGGQHYDVLYGDQGTNELDGGEGFDACFDGKKTRCEK